MSKTIKANLDLEFVILARTGDAILNKVIREHVKELKKRKIVKNLDMVSFFISNDFISRFKLGKFKLHRVNQNDPNLKGDLVEAYIAFLYINRGYDGAKKYIIKQLTNTLTLN